MYMHKNLDTTLRTQDTIVSRHHTRYTYDRISLQFYSKARLSLFQLRALGMSTCRSHWTYSCNTIEAAIEHGIRCTCVQVHVVPHVTASARSVANS